MPDRSTVISPAANSAWVYDPQHDALHFVSTTSASLLSYDLVQGGFSAPLALGGTPSSIAITPDGQTLVIGNAELIGGALAVTRVNLATHAVDQVQTSTYVTRGMGVAEIAVDASGTVLFNTRLGVGGQPDIHLFSANAPTPTVLTSTAFQVIDSSRPGGFAPWSYLISSPNHRFILVQDGTHGAPSKEALYDSATASLIAINTDGDFEQHASAAQTGRGAITNSGLIVDVTYLDIKVFDPHLKIVHDLSSYPGAGFVVGAAFSQDERELFLWNAEQGKVIVVDTQSWAQVATLNTVLGGGGFGAGSMLYSDGPAHSVQLVEHGTMLALNDGKRVELIDLAARLPLAIGPEPVGQSSEPSLGLAPVITATVTGKIEGDMDAAQLADLLPAVITRADAGGFIASGANGLQINLVGDGLTYANDQLVGGSVSQVTFADVRGAAKVLSFHIAGFGTPIALPAAQFETWLVQNNTAGAFQTLLGGSDRLLGGAAADLVRSYAGNDLIEGLGGADTLWGGAGDDVIFALAAPERLRSAGASGATFLRGEDGADYIVGGDGFDNINGNQGNDTAAGGAGDDWVVGGKDQDMLFGEGGADIVLGNLGDDTCVGGDGQDQIRGGQGQDVLYGGLGSDYLSGDRGNDTITGGGGADFFHTFPGAGIDRVLDFDASQGDRVMLDPGTVRTVSQVGADTVIDMGAGDQMVLVGVTASSLPAGWIFEAWAVPWS